jgi:hypothetical protein
MTAKKYVKLEDFDLSLQTRILHLIKKRWERNKQGYTRTGIMEDLFKVPSNALSKSWKLWEQKHRNWYLMIVRALNNLESENKIIVKKNKTPFGYFFSS